MNSPKKMTNPVAYGVFELPTYLVRLVIFCALYFRITEISVANANFAGRAKNVQIVLVCDRQLKPAEAVCW